MTVVSLLGAAAIIDSAVAIGSRPVGASWLVLAALTWIGGSFALRVPQVPASISVSETFVFMILLLFGGPPATLTVAADGLLTSALRDEKRLRRVAFGMAEPAVSMWVASHAFAWLSNAAPLTLAGSTLGALVLPMLLMTSVYFLMNSGLTAFAISTETGQPPLAIWQTHFVGVSLGYFVAASIALLVALNTREVSWWSFGAVLPLVLLLYATFRTGIRRSEDASRHLAEMSRLHLSTVESLAMAIDAKDQVTHGHIRRVQSQAIELGRRLGLEGDGDLRALETAALLHDMGKLAVPDYILNKPGKLTPQEYERVKHHAVVGAEILSAVEFPYPVVPIVRHHHENWDGSGYPDGLAGESIPLGARILAVVDCYDALTSDRPYRRAMKADEAVEIIKERRGSLYDPGVVDAFLALQPSIAPLTAASRPVAPAAIAEQPALPAAGEPSAAAELVDFAAATGLFEAWSLVETHAEDVALDDLVELVSRRLRRLTPATLTVLYRVDAETQELVAVHASGTGEAVVEGTRVAFGHGTAGWTAVNLAPLVNGDPDLDLGARAEALEPRLASGLTVPLVSGTAMVGVLACYAPARQAFNGGHLRIVGALGAALAPELVLDDAIAEAVSMPPRFDRRPRFLSTSRSCVVVAIAPLARASDASRTPSEGLPCPIAAATLTIVRQTDVVVRGPGGETLVLCVAVDEDFAATVSERLQGELDKLLGPERVAVAAATAPRDGQSFTSVRHAAWDHARDRAEAALKPVRAPARDGRSVLA